MADSDGHPHVIGVGMGGACPECRAPVDLGQEFCLECGAAVRIPREKKKRAGTVRREGKPDGGFPWLIFAGILVAVSIGVGFLLFSSSGTTDNAKVDTGGGGLPSLTNSTGPDTTGTDTVPTTTPMTTPTIPTTQSNCDAMGTPGMGTLPCPTSTSTVPTTATTPATTTAATATSPTTTTTTTTTTGTGTTPSTDATTWPASKTGYTVVLASLSKALYSEDDAQTRAAQAQQKGLKAGVIDSDQFSSLTDGLWVVFTGVYDTESAAKSHLPEAASAGYQGAYVRQIKP